MGDLINYLINAPWFYGLFLVSTIVGAAGSYVVFLALTRIMRITMADAKGDDWWYTGFWTGVFERFFFTCGIGLLGKSGGMMAAMATWIAVKGQAHYRMFSDAGRENTAKIYLGLLGSLGSLLFAIWGGYAWRGNSTLSCVLVWLKDHI